MIYLIPAEKRVTIKYTPETFDLFAINPRENNKIIAITPDNTIYALSNSDIQAMKLAGKKSGDKVRFELKKYQLPAKEAGHIDEVIAGL